MRRTAVAFFLSLCLVSAAVAQSAPERNATALPTGSGQDTPVRIQSSTQMFLAGPTDGSEEAQKLRDTAQRLVYEMAGRSCQMLYDTIAKDCRLEAVNVNLSRQMNLKIRDLMCMVR